MYGMVNNIIKDYIIRETGEEGWQHIREEAGIQMEEFVSMQQYPDEVSGAMVGAFCGYTSMDGAAALEEIGLFFIQISKKHYDYYEVLEMAGDTLPDMLQNLDELHVRVADQFEELRPPSFWCTEIKDDSLILHYDSPRDGLGPMIVGLVKGLGEMIHVTCEVKQTVFKSEGASHDEFHVLYTPTSISSLPSDKLVINS